MTRKKKFHGKDIPSEHARRRQEQEEKTKDMAAGIRANRVTLSDVQKGYTEEGRIKAAMAKKKQRAHPEADLQKAVFDYLKAQYPNIVAFAIPNGAKRGKYAQRELKQTGCLKGVPDLFVAKRCVRHNFAETGEVLNFEIFNGLFIELKNGADGRVTLEQINAHKSLRRSGYAVFVCRSFDEAKIVIDEYLKQ